MKTIISKRKEEIMLLGLFVVLGVWISLISVSSGYSQAYNETSLVNTTVNITNAAPAVTAITLDTPINLRSYNITQVYCNATIYDYDNDTVTLNASLYKNGETNPLSPNDGNNKYFNSSCARTSVQDNTMNYTCVFNVQYYADNSSSWICNITAADGGLLPASNLSNFATINPLVAIKMDPLLDYGDLAVGETSNDTLANITNAGNRNANISVEGYAVTPGDGLAFDCDFGSIALSYERYNSTAGIGNYADMAQLLGATTQIENGFYVPQRTSESVESTNSTYWKVYIPVGAGGVCNGKILFTASDRG